MTEIPQPDRTTSASDEQLDKVLGDILKRHSAGFMHYPFPCGQQRNASGTGNETAARQPEMLPPATEVRGIEAVPEDATASEYGDPGMAEMA